LRRWPGFTPPPWWARIALHVDRRDSGHRKGAASRRLTLADIDLFEVNEAFAPVVLAWAKDTGADLARRT